MNGASLQPACFPRLLEGVRVLDASRILAGPFCGQILGDLGAEVIKVEMPGTGDDTRRWGPPFLPAGPSAYYLSCNRNKKGVAVHLGHPQGVEVFRRLLARSDVLIENFRTSSLEGWGLAAENLREINPRLVHCSISGFGRTGPLADQVGYDFSIQALSGLMSITGPVDGPPSKAGVAITDVLTGLYASTAILACLWERTRSGKGYCIDLSLMDCAVASQVNLFQAFLTNRQIGLEGHEANPPRQGNSHYQIVPYQMFPTQDGHLVLAIGSDAQWRRWAEHFAPELAKDARFLTNQERVRHREILLPAIEATLKQKTTADWIRLLPELDIPHAPVQTYADLAGSPWYEARPMSVTIRDHSGQPVDLVGNPFHIQALDPTRPVDDFPGSVPPNRGADTDALLRDVCGYAPGDVEALRQQGAIE